MNNKLTKLITSDFGLPIALLLLAAIVGAVERGFLNMLNGITAVLLALGVTSFVASLAMILSARIEKKLFVYIFLVSSAVIFAASFGLYISEHGKLIIVALVPGVILGLVIAFLSKR